MLTKIELVDTPKYGYLPKGVGIVPSTTTHAELGTAKVIGIYWRRAGQFNMSVPGGPHLIRSTPDLIRVHGPGWFILPKNMRFTGTKPSNSIFNFNGDENEFHLLILASNDPEFCPDGVWGDAFSETVFTLPITPKMLSNARYCTEVMPWLDYRFDGILAKLQEPLSILMITGVGWHQILQCGSGRNYVMVDKRTPHIRVPDYVEFWLSRELKPNEWFQGDITILNDAVYSPSWTRNMASGVATSG